MSTHSERAEFLLSMATRLATMIEEDSSTLRARRPAQLVSHQAEREALMLQYTKAVAEFRKTHVKGSLPPALKARLDSATTRLMSATREHTRLLTRFRHVTEGMLKAVANVVVAQETPGIYGKSGAFATRSGNYRAAALTLNQAV